MKSLLSACVLVAAVSTGCDYSWGGDGSDSPSKDPETSPTESPTPEPQPTDAPPPPDGDTPPIFDLTQGTRSSEGKFVARMEWVAGPVAEDYSKAKLTFATPTGLAPKAVDGLVFDPQMPSMGHGTYTDDQVIKLDAPAPYTYVVEGVYFIMGGPWVVRVTANVDGQTDTVEIPAVVP